MWSLENDVVLAAASHYIKNNKARNDSVPLGEPPLFCLPEADSYFSNCGQLFLTTNYLLVFHCSVCNNKYGTLFHFLQHLATRHKRAKNETSTAAHCSTKEVIEDEENLESLHEYVYLEVTNSNEDEIKPNRENIEMKELIHLENDTGDDEADRNKTFNEIDEDSGKYENDEINVSLMEESEATKISNTTHKKFVRKCDKCDRVFSKKQNWNIHILSHSNVRLHECPICGTTVKYKQNLQKHILRHTNEKNFKCEICDKEFFTRTEVKIHERTHTGERPYFCFKCGDSFKSTGNLSAHMKRHENLRTKKCGVCGKGFNDMYRLKEHMVGHSNERPYACKFCSSSFSRRKTLVQHTKLHVNAREYACSLCDKSFNQRPALLSHMNNNHKALEYSTKLKNAYFNSRVCSR